MALVFPNSQLSKILAIVANQEVPADLKVHLFQNDYTPAPGNFGVVDLTEANFSGYAAIPLTAANWNFTAGTTSVAQYNAAQQFAADASSQDQNVYGYYLTYLDGTTETLLYAERFPNGPYYIDQNLDSVSVTPRITITNSVS